MITGQSTQVESAAPPCRTCKGAGSIAFQSCSHAGQNCPCPSDDRDLVDCPRCDGSAVEGCDHCGEPSTHIAPFSDQPICAECDERMYGEPSDPDGEDYGWSGAQELDRQMAEARKLK